MRKSSPPSAEATAAVCLVDESLHEALDAAHRSGDQGATFRGLGKRTGLQHQHIHEWTLALSGRTPKVAQVLELGGAVAVGFFEILLAKLRSRGVPACDLRHLALGAVSSSGQLANEVRKAFADDRLELEEIDQIQAAAMRLQADASAVLSECARARLALRGAP